MSWNEPRWEGGIWTTGTLLQFKPTLLLQGIFWLVSLACDLILGTYLFPSRVNIQLKSAVINLVTPLRLKLLLLCAFFSFSLTVSLLKKKKKRESEWLIHSSVISFSGGRSGWLTVQYTRIKCGQSYIHAVNPSPFKFTTHWLEIPTSWQSCFLVYWLMEALFFSFFLFCVNTAGGISKKPSQCMLSCREQIVKYIQIVWLHAAIIRIIKYCWASRYISGLQ